MEDEIKVGEWVRSIDGYIGKIIKIQEKERDCDTYYVTDKTMASGFYEHILKHSFNIIDLIEANDYVNGRLVLQVDYKNKNVCLLIPFTDTKANTNIMWYGYEDIKSIVTHQQFKSIEYTIHEREKKENE